MRPPTWDALGCRRDNAASSDVIVCAVTSNLVDPGHSVLIGPQDMESGELRRPSRVKAAAVASLSRSIVRKRVGQIKAAPFAQVLREFESLFA